MTPEPTDTPRVELLLGGQRSGKSRAAEARAARWLARPGRSATLVATALAGDEEMAARIARHQADRAARVPGLRTHESPGALSAALDALAADPGHLVVVDCVTLWLSQLAMPPPGGATPLDAEGLAREGARLVEAVRRARGPVVLVSNEIGLGLVATSSEVRGVVDALGRLHQDLAAAAERVTLLVAGCELRVKPSASHDPHP